MLDPKQQAASDQAFAWISDNLPPALWTFHSRLMDQGFNSYQALTLTNTYLAELLRNNRGTGGGT